MGIGSVVKFYLADAVRLVKGRASKQRVLCVGSKSCPLRSGQIPIFVEGGTILLTNNRKNYFVFWFFC